MNEKSFITLETVKNERTYSLVIPIGAPLGEVHDALYEFLGNIVERANKALEDSKKKEAPASTEEAAS